MNKGSTLYAIENTIHMLPLKLNDQLKGFKTNINSKALSVCTLLGKEGEIIEYKLQKSIIKPTYNLSYKEADEIIDYEIQEEIDLIKIKELMDKRRSRRLKKGAIIIDQPQGVFINSLSNPELSIVQKSRSRLFIEELMILMNTIIAEFCSFNKIMILYRAQELKQQINYNLNLNYDVFQSYKKSVLSKATLTIKPSIHKGLGLLSYTQSTSPIRRYSDFIVQKQIINFINRKNRLSPERLENILGKLKIAENNNKEVIREEQRMAQINWFRQNQEKDWSTYFIKFLNKSENIVVLRFKDLEQDIAVKIDNTENWKIGDELTLIYKNSLAESSELIFQIK
tara:strand:- start:173 stop:1192 length:1020 start_codon:yes stop_codon:yes gene_type:complete